MIRVSLHGKSGSMDVRTRLRAIFPNEVTADLLLRTNHFTTVGLDEWLEERFGTNGCTFVRRAGFATAAIIDPTKSYARYGYTAHFRDPNHAFETKMRWG